MATKILVIDCLTAGITGRMLFGSLLDLGANEGKVREALASIQTYVEGCRSLQMIVETVRRKGILSKLVRMKIDEAARYRTASEIKDIIKSYSKEAGLSAEVISFVNNVYDSLIEAEARIHGRKPQQLRLYELGSTEAIAQVIGVAIALDDLKLFEDTEVYSTPVAIGGGLVTISHGRISVPTPSTLEILRMRGFPVIGRLTKDELTTPLGSAILANLARHVIRAYPPMIPRAVGYGAGDKDYKGFPNILRAILGKAF